MKLAFVTAAVALLVCVHIANAGVITDITCSVDGDGAVTMNHWDWDPQSTASDGEMVAYMDETLRGFPAHALVDITVAGDPNVWFYKEVDNASGFAWTGYRINIVRDQAFSIVAAVAPAAWTYTITPAGVATSGPYSGKYVGTIDYAGGPAIQVGDTGTFQAKVNFADNANFTLEQIPVPEPATLPLLASTAMLMRRRLRRHS